MATDLQEYREQYSRLMALHLVFFVLSVLNGRSSAKADIKPPQIECRLPARSRPSFHALCSHQEGRCTQQAVIQLALAIFRDRLCFILARFCLRLRFIALIFQSGLRSIDRNSNPFEYGTTKKFYFRAFAEMARDYSIASTQGAEAVRSGIRLLEPELNLDFMLNCQCYNIRNTAHRDVMRMREPI